MPSLHLQQFLKFDHNGLYLALIKYKFPSTNLPTAPYRGESQKFVGLPGLELSLLFLLSVWALILNHLLYCSQQIFDS
uniref:Ovule protein n=1 Tax=Acrobeloides nanus TaxID=290746 RepID=A0A914DMP0_9BILA